MMELSSESERELADVPVRLRVAWAMSRRFWRYLQACSGVLVAVVTGVVQEYGVADVTSFIRSTFSDSKSVAVYTIIAAATFLAIKSVTALPKGFSAHSRLDEGE